MNGKILAVDDDEILLKLIKRTLESDGYEVFTATCGQDALGIFSQITPDVVILDIMMPDMDGWQVCHHLRQTSCVPIIFLSALSTVHDVVQGLMTGADDYLTKPFEIAEFRARVAALMRRARMTPTPPQILRFNNRELIINRTEQ
jgi:DNA-binding response OmpR family regulator